MEPAAAAAAAACAHTSPTHPHMRCVHAICACHTRRGALVEMYTRLFFPFRPDVFGRWRIWRAHRQFYYVRRGLSEINKSIPPYACYACVILPAARVIHSLANPLHSRRRREPIRGNCVVVVFACVRCACVCVCDCACWSSGSGGRASAGADGSGQRTAAAAAWSWSASSCCAADTQ